MKRLQLLFIVLTLYILLQFGWWAYMLASLNKEVYSHKMELIQLHEGQQMAEEQAKLQRKLMAKWWMIGGEGLVFIALLSYGIYQTYIAFRKEYGLAKIQKNFLLSVTHEFKSPLAAVKLNVQTMARHKLSDDQIKSILQSTLQETDRLNDLVENALTAARIDTHSYKVEKSKVDLTQLVQSIVEMKRHSDEQYKGVTLHLDKNVTVQGDEMGLTSVILNLLENAIKYSFEEVHVEVSLFVDGDNVILTVADRGIGLNKDDRGKIFDKFFRAGNEDTRMTKGTGLGLYIVKKIVELHRGSISVADNVPRGAIFRVVLPLR